MSEDSAHELIEQFKIFNKDAGEKFESFMKPKAPEAPAAPKPGEQPKPADPAPKKGRSLFRPFFLPDDE